MTECAWCALQGANNKPGYSDGWWRCYYHWYFMNKVLLPNGSQWSKRHMNEHFLPIESTLFNPPLAGPGLSLVRLS